MFKDKETCCFMHLVFRLITDGQYYLLPVKEYENIRTDKILLGYYNEDYIYIVPDVVVRKGNLMGISL